MSAAIVGAIVGVMCLDGDCVHLCSSAGSRIECYLRVGRVELVPRSVSLLHNTISWPVAQRTINQIDRSQRVRDRHTFQSDAVGSRAVCTQAVTRHALSNSESNSEYESARVREGK